MHALSRQYRIDEAYHNVDKLLAVGVDAVMIHSATESHFVLVSQFLQAGIAVFVDKPLSYSLRESEQLLNLAAQKNLPLFVGFNRRFASLIQPLAKARVRHLGMLSGKKNRINLPDKVRTFVLDVLIACYSGFLGSAHP